MITSLGRVKTSLKSDGFNVNPIPNITIPNKGLMALVLIQRLEEGTKRARAEIATMRMVMCDEIHWLIFRRVDSMLFFLNNE